MRITFVLPTVDMSGGIRVIAIYAKALVARGHTVKLVSPPPRRALRRKLKSLIRGKGWPAAGRAPASHLDGSGLDHRVLDHWRPVTDADVPDADVVIATWWETAEWVAELGAEKGAKAYFVQAHEIHPYLPVARCHATYRLPLHKIVISRWLADVMRDQYGDDCVDLVPNSVDPAQFFALERGKQRLPTVGLLYSTAAYKAVEVAVAAVAEVHERMPELRVVSFGSDRQDAALPLPEYVRFFFSPPQEEIRNLYAQCDAWISASRSEGFNLPAMEAMACRTPIVSTRTGWPEEVIVSGRNGVLTEIDNVGALAQGLEWILRLPDDEWRMLSQRAYETAREGSWEASSRLFEEALKRASVRAARGEIGGNRAQAA
ncbi:MAG: glycosyl transferase group 1 [Betaproteobacteria bacterium]|nr:glycosyl transferase group 1 [Betaproteobacteria bacterium]